MQGHPLLSQPPESHNTCFHGRVRHCLNFATRFAAAPRVVATPSLHSVVFFLSVSLLLFVSALFHFAFPAKCLLSGSRLSRLPQTSLSFIHRE
ncbi:hypothetical protein EJ02DRAFT_213883 [Clathrospora elynae]|uniref:Transmembrane protein n=1 Tax=Clathrospora elynae TaxID=706981 RepID=A0A6A5SMD9_9PLEO|nr:hypothetical protein EJ02DRAFT_213883 [Clathrospora elynae]